MNNNKKYKKWSLGLVAPALVLAPIAVVASCSSSTEEKEAYGVTFTNNNEIRATIHKAVQPTDLTKDQFKEEVLAHKNELFTIEGTLPSESFLNNNIEIADLNASDDDKTVSTNVKLNKANTSGESIQKTITLTGLGYQEVDLNGKTYTIAFKETQNPQEIPLDDQSGNSVESLTSGQLLKLVIAKKDEILTINGTDASKITNDVLENQILTIESINKDKTTGKITFTLNVAKPTNGAGQTLTKEITFTGFKVETDKGDETTMNAEVSTITLGLNGNVDEIKASNEMDSTWILKNKDLFFEKGSDLIDEPSISKIIGTPFSGDNTKMSLQFEVAANKYYDQDGNLGKNPKQFSIEITDVSADPTTSTVIKEKFDKNTPLSISKINPSLSTLNIDDGKAKLEDKTFLYEYMKHFLTGDFSLINQESDLFKADITVTKEADNVLKVEFEIPEQKTLTGPNAQNPNPVSISFKLNGFATTK